MESDVDLAVGEEVWIQFTIKEIAYAKRCEVIKILEKGSLGYKYAMRFFDVNTRSQENLARHLMQLQMQRSRMKRGA